jgi:hypothetical protein
LFARVHNDSVVRLPRTPAVHEAKNSWRRFWGFGERSRTAFPSNGKGNGRCENDFLQKSIPGCIQRRRCAIGSEKSDAYRRGVEGIEHRLEPQVFEHRRVARVREILWHFCGSSVQRSPAKANKSSINYFPSVRAIWFIGLLE